MIEPQNEVKRAVRPLTVPLLFVVIFAILLLGQYASKTGALLLNEDNQSTAFLFIAIGYSCLVTRGLIWIILLKYVRLSVAYPIQALSFVLIALLGVFVFQEILTTGKILGIVLILTGVTSIALSK
ncbi:MAG: hypothetical protein DHS20C18_38230 [Saprospiraceae bacterium]|nr:MAG: hypothetical protein DHS20C18_38230 [Saprospiraceae bacterium]